ncbi:hypothetical protein PHMEG_00038292 [Phytophthora megakarya]|uniref:Uncharacterized protein n=1 Tax=Phytophthora megakarya TaxID=4795 RepID=A0A225UI71_9STRA|nr:hypothetical protein PHMEG_00038292 [Phytophthora megakarya]
MQTQFQMQMQQANSRFEYLLAAQGDRRKKDPPTYEGKFGEDLELWIFATEEYYANKRGSTGASTFTVTAREPGFCSIEPPSGLMRLSLRHHCRLHSRVSLPHSRPRRQ